MTLRIPRVFETCMRYLACICAALLLPAVTRAGSVDGPLWAGPAVTGAWFDPARSGEGIVVQVQPDGSAIAFWFTYPAPGEAGAQAWLVAQGGVVDGARLRFATVLRPVGGVFGAAFDPGQISYQPWGSMELEVRGCSEVLLRYVGPAAFGSGERVLTRLSNPDQIDCAGTRSTNAAGARAVSGLRARTGTWFVPERGGEGWLVEDLGGGISAVFWFTFDPAGQQAWLLGVGPRTANRIDAEAVITAGTRFGNSFDAAQVVRRIWGTVRFEFHDCGRASVTYASSDPAYGGASREAVRLTAVAGAECVDGMPQARTRGNWTEHAPMPAPAQSELAATRSGTDIYVLGGYGDPRGFKRYDTVLDRWARLPDLPAGRDHLAAFVLADAVWYSGGEPNGDGDQLQPGFRYDIASATWTPAPVLRPGFGSHAAVLFGRAYIGSEDGSLQEFDPRQGAARTIRPAGSIARDHSQVVAFLGEIWMIAGRAPETTSVSIYDPITERWRFGPPLGRARGGFAAAVLGQQIVVAGGEVLGGGTRLERSLEVYAAGADGWVFGPELPLAVHGVGGAAVGTRFYVLGGSTRAGSASFGSQRTFSVDLQP